ncbi:flavin containing amine oxidoreductase domain-containing protein [Phthorimaea operculella]|nr:flavin containing amine oxidoreductase domain-containing protein [Phthorimaea operculella]
MNPETLARRWPRILRWKSDKSSEKPDSEPAKCQKPEVLYDHRPDMLDRGIYAVDPCNAHLSYEQPRVVIVGAGMAGLAAAAKLTERGINNYTILEAYERPGGRILSSWLGDVVTELGANWKQDNCCTHPVYRMSAAEDPPRPGVPAVHHSRGLFSKVTSGKLPFPPTIAAYYKFRTIEQEAASLFAHGGYKQHGSMINFMSLRIQQELHSFPEDQQHDAARIMFGLCHTLSARSGDDTGLLCSDHTGCYMNMPGGDVRVPLGLIGIVAPLLREIPSHNLRYCKPVNCIYWGTCPQSEYRAVVTCADGEQFPADYVIITVSLGVLEAYGTKMFCPALPGSKLDAIRCLGFGFCNKVYLEYSRPFWYWQTTNLNFKFCCGELSHHCDWTRGIVAIEIVPNSKHVMCALVVGEPARQMEGVCDRDVAEGVTEVLRLCTGTCVPYPSAIQRSHWATDPYFLGAYSFENCCGFEGCAQQALACPLPGPGEPVPPILLFAGEATMPGHYATIAGARLTGIREAERIVQLTLQYKGPPKLADECLLRKNISRPCGADENVAQAN